MTIARLLVALASAALLGGCAKRTFNASITNASDRTLGVQFTQNAGPRSKRLRFERIEPGATSVIALSHQRSSTASAIVTIADQDPELMAYAIPLEAGRPVRYDVLVVEGRIVPIARVNSAATIQPTPALPPTPKPSVTPKPAPVAPPPAAKPAPAPTPLPKTDQPEKKPPIDLPG